MYDIDTTFLNTIFYFIIFVTFWNLLGLIGRLILTSRAEKVNNKSALWYLSWIPLIGWFITARSANKSIIWPILILISTSLNLYELYSSFSVALQQFNVAFGGEPPVTTTDVTNQTLNISYLLALIAEFIILRGLAKTLNFSLLRTIVIFVLGGPFWFMKNRFNKTSTQTESEKIEYL